MDYEQYFELGWIVATSLIGALSATIYLLKTKKIKMLLKERKPQLKFPDSMYWNTHTRIHETLTELRVKTDCARAQLVQFHNSGHFLDGISMKKMSLTHESLEKGVSSEMSLKKDLLISMCIDGMNLLLKDDPQLYMVSDLEDSWCKQFMENSNVVSFSFLPIRNKGVVIGYVMCQWCSWSKTYEIIEDIAIEEITNSRKLIEVQLSHEREKMINK